MSARCSQAARCWLGVFLFPSFLILTFFRRANKLFHFPISAFQIRCDLIHWARAACLLRRATARQGRSSIWGAHATRVAAIAPRNRELFFILPIVMRDSALSELDASPFYRLHFDNLNPLFP